MAKADEVNVIEMYVEKGVLGVCVLLLLYAFIHWVVSSPRQIEVTTGISRNQTAKVSPSQVDAKLLQTAERISAKHEGEEPPEIPPIKIPQQIKNLRKGPFGSRSVSLLIVLSSPHRPAKLKITQNHIPGMIATSNKELSEVTPAPPVIYAGIERELPHAPGKLADVDIARVVTIYPMRAALRTWQAKLMGQVEIEKIIVLGVEAEVLVGQAGVPWGNIKPRKVKAVILPMRVEKNGQLVTFAKIPEIPKYMRYNYRNVKNAISQVSLLQENILQPKYWGIWGQEGRWVHWRRHLPKKFLDKMGIRPPDEEAVKPTAPPKVTKPARPSSDKKRKPITREGPPEMYRSGPVRRKDTDRKSTKPTRTDEPKRLDSPAEKQPTRIVQADDTIKLPSFQEQQASGKVFVWIHDTSVQPLKIYRYRIRLKLLNPLFMQEKRLPRSHRRDALEASIPTPWSPWSEPVSTSKVTEFFLTGSIRSSAVWRGTSPSEGKVLVTVFTRCLGQRVKHTFALTKGQAIGAKVLKRVPNPAWQPDQSDPQQVDQYLHEQADFSTGAVIVDINFNKTISRNGIPLQTVEIIYADDKGNLNRCIRAQHLLTNSELQKRYQQLLKETQKTGFNSIAKQK